MVALGFENVSWPENWLQNVGTPNCDQAFHLNDIILIKFVFFFFLSHGLSCIDRDSRRVSWQDCSPPGTHCLMWFSRRLTMATNRWVHHGCGNLMSISRRPIKATKRRVHGPCADAARLRVHARRPSVHCCVQLEQPDVLVGGAVAHRVRGSTVHHAPCLCGDGEIGRTRAPRLVHPGAPCTHEYGENRF